MEEFSADGTARLWNPPFDLLPLVVRKIETEDGLSISVGSPLASACLVCALAKAMVSIDRTSSRRGRKFSDRGGTLPGPLVGGTGGDSLQVLA